MRLTCPACHATVTLEALCESDAARQMFVLLVQLEGGLVRVLAAYLSFFRRQGPLAWERALRLANEVLDLEVNHGYLELALARTVEFMRPKREGPDWKPLNDHTYLQKVLRSVREEGGVPALERQELARAHEQAKPEDLAPMTEEQWQQNAERVRELQRGLFGGRHA